MYISKLTIRNYRNFSNAVFHFSKGVNTIIGENGSGKTNALVALRLLIDDSLPRAVRYSENDFNRSLKNWRGHWIAICVEFQELDLADEIQSLAVHKSGLMDGTKKGTYNLYIRPKEVIRKRLFDYSEEEDKSVAGLNLLLEEIELHDYEYVFRGRGSINISDDEQYKKYVGDFDNVIFPNPDIKEEDAYGVRLNSISIPSELSCTFVKALRDVESDLRSYRNNPLLSLLRGKGKDIEISKKNDIESKVETLNSDISDLTEIKKVSDGIQKSIRGAVGETYAPNIGIRSELPNDMESLLQSLNLWVGDPDEHGHQGKIWELSLGGANLIYLSLKLLEYEQVKSTDRVANFLLIEEPEAHIHTHIQKSLFDNIGEDRTQVIITTHSTHISSVSNISAMNILSRDNQFTQVHHPAAGLKKNKVNRLERYLDAVRSTLLFAKGVVLVEGDAEQILIPTLFKSAFGVSLDEIGVSIVNIGSTGFMNVAQIFDDSRLRRKCAILTDADKSIVKLSDDPNDDTDLEKSCRNSEKSGKLRRVNLDKTFKDHNWVKPFYADYTFEVDFLLNGNSHEIKNVIDKIYTKDSFKERSKALIDKKTSDESGVEVLRLANKVGKGWFAIHISEQLLYNTFIPDYILKSIAFASPIIKDGTILSMIKYITSAGLNNDQSRSQVIYKELNDELHKNEFVTSEFIESYKTNLPKDQLTKFLTFLNE